MCHHNRYIHRCGHSDLGPLSCCPNSKQSPVTGRWNMCSKRSETRTNQGFTLCECHDCILSSKGGVWICCCCSFGCKGADRNRSPNCVNTACGHEICDYCLQWTRENVQAMIEAEWDESSSNIIEPSSPSKQEYWDSDKEVSDAVDDNATTEENEGSVSETEDHEIGHSDYH